MARLLLRELVKRYGGRNVVDSVSLDLESGEVVGLLGPNGAGKTTTFYMAVGLISPDGGTISIDEEDITSDPIHIRARKGIGYLPQESSVFKKLTVEQNIKAVLEYRKITKEQIEKRTASVLEDLGIAHLARNKAGVLSGGERRRLEIARVLSIDPSFILLDEPFAGIDPLAVADIQSIIGQLTNRGIGVLVSDHNVRETLGVCDKAYILNRGAIIEAGTPHEIANSQTARSIYLGETFRL
ncbi:MAG: LPS export ABC transporter ATP-binding protein [Desulfococcus sp. 4484_241]|nr:MAG: LPS export ABC transporter ATP-binding protein [Desulfococcus sp. 4484_241]